MKLLVIFLKSLPEEFVIIMVLYRKLQFHVRFHVEFLPGFQLFLQLFHSRLVRILELFCGHGLQTGLVF